MNTQLSRWGNSLAVRIPKAAVDNAGFREGERLNVSVEQNGVLVIRSAQRRYSLKQLVSGITNRNRHKETDWGGPAGKESW